MASLLNALIGEYRVVESLGAGGMGEVYKAVHTHFGRVIAIKVLSPELADGPALKRFYGEADIQASLNQPGVAEYFGFYEYQGRPCIFMEYVDGETLASIVRRRGPLPAPEAVRILGEIAAVAANFHARGVVHRDLKTNNVKINSAGRVKILDFGIARHQSSTRLTRVGAVIGTPEILAPEQIRGEPSTQATDVWQLGVMFYELLTARLPFQADTAMEICARILSAEHPPASRWQPSVPAALDRILARCLKKDAARRYRDAAELHEALGEWERSVAPKERSGVLEIRPAPAPVAVAVPVVAAAPRVHVPAWVLGLLAVVVVLVGITLALRPWHQDDVVIKDGGSKTSSGETTAPVKSVTVDTFDGVAQVFRDGKLVGATPYRVEERSGKKVELMLRREGYKDLPLEFELTERHNYTYTMERVKGR